MKTHWKNRKIENPIFFPHSKCDEVTSFNFLSRSLQRARRINRKKKFDILNMVDVSHNCICKSNIRILEKNHRFLEINRGSRYFVIIKQQYCRLWIPKLFQRVRRIKMYISYLIFVNIFLWISSDPYLNSYFFLENGRLLMAVTS